MSPHSSRRHVSEGLSSEGGVSPEELRGAMRLWPTGVAVVTVQDDGVPHGMTVNSFSCLSLDPPLVLISLQRGTRTQILIDKTGLFGVSILGADQRLLSERFATAAPWGARLDGLTLCTMNTGIPLVEGAPVRLDCAVENSMAAGTHEAYVGRVVALHALDGSQPLIYYDRTYRSLTP